MQTSPPCELELQPTPPGNKTLTAAFQGGARGVPPRPRVTAAPLRQRGEGQERAGRLELGAGLCPPDAAALTRLRLPSARPRACMVCAPRHPRSCWSAAHRARVAAGSQIPHLLPGAS